MTTPDSGHDPQPDDLSADLPAADRSVPSVPPVSGDEFASHESRALADAKQAVTKIEHTASRATVVGWVVGIVVTIFLLIFILKNQGSQTIDLVFGKVDLPVGVSLLIAAIAGAIITLAITGTRMIQLRRALKRVEKSAQSSK